VVREHLGMIFGAAERLDPRCDLSVLLRALGSCDLAVRDVTYEGVGEGELALALDGRTALLANEGLPRERVQG
jgi:hypothetical protein